MEKRALGWARKQEKRTVSLAAVCLEADRSGNLDLGEHELFESSEAFSCR